MKRILFSLIPERGHINPYIGHYLSHTLNHQVSNDFRVKSKIRVGRHFYYHFVVNEVHDLVSSSPQIPQRQFRPIRRQPLKYRIVPSRIRCIRS